MSFLTVHGNVTHYRDEGPRAAAPLVFINSLGSDLRIWDELVADFAGDHRVLRYDKRGHGLSGLPDGAAAIADYARDLEGLLEALGVAQATLVGLSIGGLIAQELYRRRPDLVRALALCDTAAKIGDEAMWSNRIAAIEAGGVAAIADAILERWFSPGFRAQRPQELAGWRLMLTRTDKAGYLAACGALRAADLRAFCADIRVPTLCMVGEVDGSTPVPLVREFAASIPGAGFEIIAGAGHLPHLEDRSAVSALLRAFLSGLA